MPRHLTTSDLGSTTQAYDAQLASVASLSFSGNGEKVVAVNASENAFELVEVSASGGGLTTAQAGARALGGI